MKLRLGFVSNSSSSSFVAIAFSFNGDKNVYREVALALGADANIFDQRVEEENDDGTEDYNYCVREVIYEHYVELFENNNIRILDGSEDGVKKDTQYVALILAEGSDDNGGSFEEDGSVSLEDSDKRYSMVCELKNKIGIDSKIEIIYGTRCC